MVVIGYNCSLFAYGQTGAGKSYSMMGYGPDKGIIPLACERIFDRIEGNTDDSLTIKVEASMLEIYMEKIRDLFNPKAGDLKIRNDPKKGFYVESLTRNAVGNYASIDKLMEAGTKARTVASTNMNATSSRAHTIFQVILTQTKVDAARGKATDKVRFRLCRCLCMSLCMSLSLSLYLCLCLSVCPLLKTTPCCAGWPSFRLPSST